MNTGVRKTLAALLADDDPDVRRRAAEDLASADGLAPVAALAAALEDESKGVRDAAGRSLCAIGGIGVARAIVEYLANTNIGTRNLAAELLVQLGPTSIPALLPYLENPDQDVRKFAVDSLGLIGSEEAVAQLLPLLIDPDDNVVVSAVEALGNIRSPRALPLLYEAYDRDAYARAAVAEAVGKIGDPSAGGFLLDRLRQSLATIESDPLTPFAIIEALGILGGDDALAMLEHLVRQVQGKLRSAVLLAIVRIAERHALPLPALCGLRPDFLAALHDADVQVRIGGAKWLVHCEGDDVTAAFVGHLGIAPDLDAVLIPALLRRPTTFDACVQALADAAPAQRKPLIALVSRLTLDTIQQIMRRGAEVFDEQRFARAFDAVAAHWERGDEETRAAVVDALFRIDGDRAVTFLDAILADPDPWLRMHVIEVIAAVADRRAPDYIARFLQDDDDMVRELAMGILQGRGYDTDPVPHGA